MKVLVTGANGQLGMTFREQAEDFPGIHFEFKSKADLDFTIEDEVDFVFKEGRYDFCINCAAYTNVEQAEKTPEKAFAINGRAVKNLAYACKKHHVTLIHISTDYIFDGEKRTPIPFMIFPI